MISGRLSYVNLTVKVASSLTVFHVTDCKSPRPSLVSQVYLMLWPCRSSRSQSSQVATFPFSDSVQPSPPRRYVYPLLSRTSQVLPSLLR